MSRLSGWRVLVPRPAGRSGPVLALLAAEGAVGQAIPTIAVRMPNDRAELHQAVNALAAGDYSWVGFTSVHAVDAVQRAAVDLLLDTVLPADTRCAAVGPATAAALRDGGFAVDLVPSGTGSATALAAAWPSAEASTSAGNPAVLLPQSHRAAPMLAQLLHAKGYQVDAMTAYRVDPLPLPDCVVADLVHGQFEAVLLTSGSTADALSGIPVAPGTVIGAIGPSTAAAAAAIGLSVDFVAPSPTPRALVESLATLAAAGRVPAPQATPQIHGK